jgi:hypothetical protein
VPGANAGFISRSPRIRQRRLKGISPDYISAEERMKTISESQVVDAAINEIKTLGNSIDSTNINKLASDLWNLEPKANALRCFILGKVVRMV